MADEVLFVNSSSLTWRDWFAQFNTEQGSSCTHVSSACCCFVDDSQRSGSIEVVVETVAHLVEHC
jgi:hypothetical protein